MLAAWQQSDIKLQPQMKDMAEVWERLAAERRRGIVENEPDSG
jgi:hypothetical protein